MVHAALRERERGASAGPDKAGIKERVSSELGRRDIVLRISKVRKYPPLARKERVEGEVRVRFTLDKYGAILSSEIETSSGSPVLDEAALAVFEEIGKLPTPPSYLKGERFTLLAPIRYSFR